MKSSFFLDPNAPTKQLLKNWQREKELKKERWKCFLKNTALSAPFYFVAVIILLLLFQLVVPDLVFSWVFVLSMAIILSLYYSDKKTIEHMKDRVKNVDFKSN